MQNMKTGDTYEFEYNNWVKVTDESDEWTEIALKVENPEDVLPVIKYQLDVYTGDKDNAGTDANVWVEVVGKRGDTGRRRLRKSLNNTNKFEQGKVSNGNAHIFDVLYISPLYNKIYLIN